MIMDIFFLDNETRMYYYLLVFILLLLLMIKNKRLIMDEYAKITKKTWIMLFIITITGLLLRIASTPMQTITEVSVWSNRYATILISENQTMKSEMHTRAYSLLVSPIYTATKDIVWSSHTFDILIGTISIIMIFMLTYLLFKDQNAAIISALILCVLPWHVFFSGTHGVELTASFFAMLSMILIYISIKSKEPEIYFLAFMSILFTALVRKEQMILFLVLLIYFIIKKNPIKTQKKYHFESLKIRSSLRSEILKSKETLKAWHASAMTFEGLKLKQAPPFKAGFEPKFHDIISYLLLAAILITPFLKDALHDKIEDGLLASIYISHNIPFVSDIFRYNFYITLLILAPIVLYLAEKKTLMKKSDSILLLIIWFSINIIPYLIHKEVYTRYFIFFLLPFIILESFSLSGLFKTRHKKSICFVLIIGLLLSATYVYSDCKQDNRCKYITAQPLHKSIVSLPEIYSLLNDTGEKNMLVIFIDNQAKEAYTILYGICQPYIVLDDREAWVYYNLTAISDESCVDNVAVNDYINFNIFVVQFESDSGLQLAEDILKYRKRNIYRTGDGYTIYHYPSIKS